MSEAEIWKDCPFDSRLKISNMGRVRMVNGTISRGHHFKRGYFRIGVRDNGKRTSKLLHRLVLQAFVGESDLEVNHKNGIKSDNRLANLEYVTREENMEHAKKNKLIPQRLGSQVPASKLTDDQVKEIFRRINNGERNRDILKDFNVSHSAISKIRRGVRWQHLKPASS